MNYFLNLRNRKFIEKNLNITKPCYSKDILICQSLGPSLHWGSTELGMLWSKDGDSSNNIA